MGVPAPMTLPRIGFPSPHPGSPASVTHLPADQGCFWLLGNGVGEGLSGGRGGLGPEAELLSTAVTPGAEGTDWGLSLDL